MKNALCCFFIISALFLVSSCAKVFYSPDAHSRAETHEKIAIIPPKVSIAAHRKVSAEAMVEQQKTESVNFQQELYSWMLQRKMQNRFYVDIQAVETTNAELRKAGYFDDNPMPPTEICELLGVDGIISSNFALSKPMSTGGAIAVGVLFGSWGPTNSANVSLEIHDRQADKVIWHYNHQLSGSLGSTPAGLVNNLMRKASRKLPYSN